MSHNTSKNSVRSLIELASSAQAVTTHTPAGYSEPTHYIKQKAQKSTVLNLKGEDLPSLFNTEGRLIRTPRGTLAGEAIKLDAALIAGSRVAAAGAAVVVMPEQSKPVAVGTGGLVAIERKPGAFAIIDPAHFSIVADDTDTPVTPSLPVSRQMIDWDSHAVTMGFRVELNRASRRDRDGDEFAEEAIASIVFGIARACDQVLLEAIVASTPAAFSIADAAAQGVAFGDLRGIVGTDGLGATISPTADLRLAGLPAELTNAVAGSIIGAFQNSAVAVHPDVHIIAERTSVAGDLVLQCFVDLVPLLPVPGRFWTVVA
jgi:hypothetical protein